MGRRPLSATVLEGLLFDGRTAAATLVQVAVGDGRLRVTTPAGDPLHEASLDDLVVTEPLASAPRHVSLAGGAVVEVTDGAALTAALAAAGQRPGLVDRLQQRWLAAVASLVASVALLAGAYVYGLPAAVRAVTAVLPASAERRLGSGVLEVLDGRFLHPSALSESEQGDAERRIAEAARLGAPGVRYQVLFRSIDQKPGVNAFALPGGTIVILDEMVRRTAADDRLVAVVGHELGHVARHHSTQSLLKAAVFAMLDYSRAAEREADEDAVRFLHAAGRSAKPMFDALCLLADVERELGMKGVPRLLSSHPDIEERLARVRAVGQVCAEEHAGAAAP